MAHHVQKRNSQSPHGNRTLRRRGDVSRRRHQRSVERQNIRLSGHARQRLRHARRACGKNFAGQAASACVHDDGSCGFFGLRQSDRACDGYSRRDLQRQIQSQASRNGLCHRRNDAKTSSGAKPRAGDAVIMVGGDTGRDGCGGATGSSKSLRRKKRRNVRRGGSEGEPSRGEKAAKIVPQSPRVTACAQMQRFRRGRSVRGNRRACRRSAHLS